MTFDVRYGIMVSMILMVASIPYAIELMSWATLNYGIPKEMIGFAYMLACIGMLLTLSTVIMLFISIVCAWIACDMKKRFLK